MRNPDVPALVAGIALLGFGGVLLLDALGELQLTFGSMAPIACAAMGATLLALGLSRGP